jgi:putative addiction module killer protein
VRLRDDRAAKAVARRIAVLEAGHFGDVRFFAGIGEMRIDVGPGYRIYFVRRGAQVILLLSGGDKGSQSRDIRRAIELAKEARNDA